MSFLHNCGKSAARRGDRDRRAATLLAALSPDDLESFLSGQPDLSPTAWPRLLRVLDDLSPTRGHPPTATHEALKRRLAAWPGGHI